MTKRMLMAAACLGLLFSSPAYASKTCYTKKDSEAEQGIRIHSELMVIGLNCQHKYKAGSENLYQAYRLFTAVHAKTFAEYENQLLDYFRRAGSKNPEADLNTMRTSFANKISLDAAKMRPDMFCYRYAPRIQKVKDMKDSDLRKWAATSYDSHPTSKDGCK